MYQVRYLRKVRKVLDNLSLPDFRRIDRRIQALRKTPRGRGCKKIGEDIYRVKVGRFRIIYHVDDEQQLIRAYPKTVMLNKVKHLRRRDSSPSLRSRVRMTRGFRMGT